MVVFDPSCLTDIRNITMYVPTQYICKIFSKRDCGILPTWYFKSVFYCLPTHPLNVIDHFFKVRYIKLGVICLPTSSYSYHMYTMCMLSTYLCTMNLSRQIRARTIVKFRRIVDTLSHVYIGYRILSVGQSNNVTFGAFTVVKNLLKFAMMFGQIHTYDGAS